MLPRLDVDHGAVVRQVAPARRGHTGRPREAALQPGDWQQVATTTPRRSHVRHHRKPYSYSTYMGKNPKQNRKTKSINIVRMNYKSADIQRSINYTCRWDAGGYITNIKLIVIHVPIIAINYLWCLLQCKYLAICAIMLPGLGHIKSFFFTFLTSQLFFSYNGIIIIHNKVIVTL